MGEVIRLEFGKKKLEEPAPEMRPAQPSLPNRLDESLKDVLKVSSPDAASALAHLLTDALGGHLSNAVQGLNKELVNKSAQAYGGQQYTKEEVEGYLKTAHTWKAKKPAFYAAIVAQARLYGIPVL